MDRSEHSTIRSWAHAGQGAIALAILLAGVGLVLAIRQTQAVPLQRVAELRPDARDAAAKVNDAIARHVRTNLRDIAAGLRTALPVEGPDLTTCPAWMPVLFVADGRSVPQVLHAHPGNAPPWVDSVTFLQLIGPRLTWLLSTQHDSTAADVHFLQESVEGRPVALAALPVTGEAGPAVIAALLDVAQLERTVLAPLLQPLSNLELVPAAARTDTWIEPLAPALPFLGLRPSTAFLSAEHAAVLRQTGVYVGIMLLVLIGLVLVMQATTRVARRERELSRLKSEFVADVSHELKTPLSLIQMFGETLRDGRVRSDEKKQEYYEIIIRESKRLTHLINNILDFSRIESGKRLYRMQRVCVGDVVRDVYEAYRHELDDKGFTHQLTVAEGLPELEVDPDAIAQAVLNLVSNAIKYSEDERWLKVELGPETRRGCRGVLITVSDRGIGIRPEDRAQVFDGFFRAPDDKVRKRRGAGLGLTLVREIAEAHRGFVEVEARLVKGTTFHLFLPQGPEQHEDRSHG
jgi:signal transduction histidine kinase